MVFRRSSVAVEARYLVFRADVAIRAHDVLFPRPRPRKRSKHGVTSPSAVVGAEWWPRSRQCRARRWHGVCAWR